MVGGIWCGIGSGGFEFGVTGGILVVRSCKCDFFSR